MLAFKMPPMPEEPLEIEQMQPGRDGECILRLSGPITLTNFFSLQARLRAETAPVTILDMGQVPYIDSAGIGMLMGAFVSRQRDGRKLLLAGVTQRVQTTMTVTRVDQFFRIFPTLADAQKSVAG